MGEPKTGGLSVYINVHITSQVLGNGYLNRFYNVSMIHNILHILQLISAYSQSEQTGFE